MLRLIVLAFGCLVGTLAVAAPVPKENDEAQLRRVYGTPLDPDKDCKFELVGGALRVSIPDKTHALGPGWDQGNAPRVFREVAGDFSVTVRVTFPIRSLGEKPGKGVRLLFAAGLVAWTPKDAIRFVRTEALQHGGVVGENFDCTRCLNTRDGIVAQRAMAITTSGQEGRAAHLRLVREGAAVTASFSHDGKKWVRFDAREVAWTEKVNVGLVAENGYAAPFEATFDEYELKLPQK